MKKLIKTQKILAITIAIMLGLFFITKPIHTSAEGLEKPHKPTYSYTRDGQIIIHWEEVKDAAGYCVKIETTTASYVYPPDITCNISSTMYFIPFENPLYFFDSTSIVTVAAQKSSGDTEDLEFSDDYATLISNVSAQITGIFTLREGYTQEDAENLGIYIATQNTGNTPIYAEDFMITTQASPEAPKIAKLRYEGEEASEIRIRKMVDQSERVNVKVVPELGLTPGEYKIGVMFTRVKRVVLDDTITITVLPKIPEEPEEPDPEKPEEPEEPDPEKPEEPEEPKEPDPEKPENPEKPKEEPKNPEYRDPLFPQTPKTPQAGRGANL